MKEKGITLSPKHGVNPSLLKCPICGKEYGLALFGRLKGDAEAPKQTTGEPCDECQQKYVTILEVTDDNYNLTGRCVHIPRTDLNIEIKSHYAKMVESEFSKMFK